MISLVVGRALNGAIGKNNDIPWSAPEDMKSFQRETMGGAIIMGRKTWDSLPVKPLKNRFNIVVSSDADAADTVVSSVDAAIALAHAEGYSRIYGIGGAGIYAAMLPLADRLLITEVELEIKDADAFFPAFDVSEWELASKRDLRRSDPVCVLHEYLRRSAS